MVEFSVNIVSIISFDNDFFFGFRVDVVYGDVLSGVFGDIGFFEGFGVKDLIIVKIV